MKDMTENKVFIADTYALIELLRGNQSYKPYLRAMLLTTKFNLVELYYYFIREHNKETADNHLSWCSKLLVPISLSCIRKAMEFKLRHREEKLSYTDCVGYALAFEFGIKFLTGDEKFGDKENVEFVR